MKRLVAAAVLASLFGFPSCATVVGTAAGPVTGPLNIEQNSAVPPWFKPFAYVISVPFGVCVGLVNGVAADWGYLVSGFEYGADGYPPFDVVFDPMLPDWGRGPLPGPDYVTVTGWQGIAELAPAGG